ncbi:TRAP transporter substrate-binding protein [Pikeienuella piscinae]|uniref:TRAP transporter substrate-binding protein n=1 Tax=Pikeienuella piscinae TaxID=2748098 RepID=A0A7L5BTS9_9RHOB|nr:TRAP transporter substrate-binding protein [Pikeienuella piscinae]QIE54902.1 TRAP transporter substrate-binding protein [Pikeienuella piscinae]
MRMSRTRGAAAALLMALAPAAQAGDVTTVNFSIFVPPTHPIYAEMIAPWVEEVERVTEGRVAIKLLPKPLGGAPQHIDLVRDGVAGAVFTVHGYTPGRFTLTKMAELPFSGDSAEAISAAYWQVHEKYFAEADEHRGVKLLGLFVHGPGMLFIKEGPVESVGDLKGVKFRVGGGMVNEVATALDMTAVLKSAPESYELLSNGVVDGILFPISSVETFRLEPFVPYALEFPGGLYNTSFMMGMNRELFDSLSEVDRDAIMSVSGVEFSRRAGRAWDVSTAKAREVYVSQGGVIEQASDALVAEVRAATAPLEEAWIEEAGKKGVDGAVALEEYRQLIQSYPATE